MRRPGTQRASRVADCEAIAALVNEVNIVEAGLAFTNGEEVRDDLTSPGHRDEDDILLAADDGSLAGYITTSRNEQLSSSHRQPNRRM
jgi:hypothetical protein